MKFGINTLLWTAAFDASHLPLLPKFKAMGFDGVEIARFGFDGFPAAQIKRAASDEGLEIVFLSALTGDLSLISNDAAVRSRTGDFLKRGIEVAAEMGSPVFPGPFCAPVGQLVGRRRTADEWKRAVEGLQSLGPVLQAHSVRLAVEPLNRFETFFLNTQEDAARLCREVGDSHVGVLFDTFHANIEEKSVPAALSGLGSHLAHVHACENDRGAPGSGHVEWAGVFTSLKAAKYNGWAVIESFGSHLPEISAAACIWRDLAASSDELAEQGLRFLRKGLA
jgi:D-psicose/D-tagatose/L-ribulose 3-epimerase